MLIIFSIIVFIIALWSPFIWFIVTTDVELEREKRKLMAFYNRKQISMDDYMSGVRYYKKHKKSAFTLKPFPLNKE